MVDFTTMEGAQSKTPKSSKKKAKVKGKSPSPGKQRENSSPSVGAKKRKQPVEDDVVNDTFNSNSSGHSKKGKSAKKSKADQTWEMAVEKARGLPDGATESPKAEDNTEAPSGNTEKRKGKAKPLHVIQNAAGKIKKLAGKKGEQPAKGKKRKLSGATEDADGAKKNKLEEMSTKDRKKQRRMMRTNYDVANKAKSMWEQLRRHDLSVEKKHGICEELFKLVKGKAHELIFAHDTSRVIQCLVKYGTKDHKNALFEELREHILEMAKSKYAKFFVRKLLKYGTKAQRDYVFRSMYGNVRKLVRHKEAAVIVELAYNDFANASQRAALIEEFYGPSFALFKTVETRTLDQIMESSPEKKETILSNMKEALSVLMDKDICQYSIVHKVLLEYFTYATERFQTEMIEIVRENLIHMLHTRDGAHVAMKCIWNGTTKDRKVIVKSMKTYVVKICKEDHGHLVLLALFDSVDDTKLVQKAILEELMKSVSDLAEDQYGRKVLLYLLSPRDPLHFHPDIVKVLQKGDGNANSKKDAAVRRQELLAAASPYLLKYICDHSKEVVMSNTGLLLLLSTLTHAAGNPEPAMKAVCEIAAEPFVAGSLDNFHMVEHTAGHLALKKLIVNDQHRKDTGQVLFSQVLLDTLPKGSLKSWAACNRGCFILVTLLELDQADIHKRVREQLLGIRDSLTRMEFKGAQVLLEKLKN